MTNTFKTSLRVTKRYWKYVFLIIPLVYIVYFIIANQQKTLTIIPNTNNLDFIPCSDIHDSGISTVDTFAHDSTSVTFAYTLREGFPYPYAGFIIAFSEDSTVVTDISIYDRFVIDLETEQEQNFQIHLREYIPGFSDFSKHMSLRFLMNWIYILGDNRRLIVPLKSFTDPPWWYNTHGVEKKDLPGVNLSNISIIVIQNDDSTPHNKSYGFRITNMRLERNIKARYIFLGIVMIAYFLVYALVLLILNKIEKKPKNIFIPYEKIQVKNYHEEEAGRIAEYIAGNYMDPYLTAARVAIETGLTSTRIPYVLKENFDLNFKQYLNHIRITEAKRLLKETDRQIVDIARTVGYNNATHFNRIFKQYETVTPKKFRTNTTTESST